VTPTFIDFEASSLDLVSSYPIEVGICAPNGETSSWLIKPHVLWLDWSAQAQEIHGIARETLIEQGLEVSEVAECLNAHLPDIVYCDAWTFDSFWLYRLYRAAKIKPRFQLESISALLNKTLAEAWQSTRESVVTESEIKTHRADNDALILHRTWTRLQQSK
jgi:hypothetical protein